MKNRKHLNLATVLVAIWLIALAWDYWSQSRSVEMVPYSAFEELLKEGRIAEVALGDSIITGRLKIPDKGKDTVMATMVEPQTAQRLAAFGVPYERVRSASWLQSLFSWILPALLLLGIWSFMLRRTGGGLGGGLLGIGKSKARIYMEKSTGVRFDDVAGVDEAKFELQEIVDFLKNPKEHARLGARMPRGVLLMGPTGTGKTLLARAVAGEAQVSFFSISGSEFIEMFVGVGAARVRDLFEQARANAPAIIFIDELDALGRARTAFPMAGGQDEREQTLNQLLVELDGFDPSVGVVLLAATNRPETLDPALLRAGRFDRQVLVDRPDRIGRAEILKVHVRKVRLDAHVDLDQVAAITVGFAGADLANLVNEAALIATRRNADAVAMPDFTQAIERIVAGIERKTRILGPHERELAATHELGHALTALALPGADKVHKVSIVPHGIGALGYTLQRPSEDRHLLRRGELLDRLAVLLGGRAAEQLVFGEPTTGAADDLVKATNLARDMVLRYGMDSGLGAVVYLEQRSRFMDSPTDAAFAATSSAAGEKTAQRIDDAVRGLIEQETKRATQLLRERREILERCVRALMSKETLDEAELLALVESPEASRTAASPGSRAIA
ncbi:MULTISPECIES: ATP-dependent zinc metalloprotease FtsH [unclassified Variovorax]|uniref:ATP-dependent zinc metalloprotease FtsH n=1 Tax=unclassified Variovorax TaxID=663243 RepID=UPI000D11D4E5|nr:MULTISPECIES: ATP-dependent zinc metalloprotease FtsH [unclassified Variovorax]AVQ85608.1 cell division protein FtsH [Variovorax sp. PMC12]QRY35236.1 ATP-dependent zinc metalloprotease FtsH [Variovorax sp. PDNC026]